MATKKAELTKAYAVSAKIKAELMVNIVANNWDEALEKAKGLGVSDFLLGEISDCDPAELSSIWISA